MDPEQQQRFREAVDRKAHAAEEASHQPTPDARAHDDGPVPHGTDPKSPEAETTRAKSQRHGKVTADKWNQ